MSEVFEKEQEGKEWIIRLRSNGNLRWKGVALIHRIGCLMLKYSEIRTCVLEGRCSHCFGVRRDML